MYDNRKYHDTTRYRLSEVLEDMKSKGTDVRVAQHFTPDGRPFVEVVAIGESAEGLLELLRQDLHPDDKELQAREPEMFPIGCIVALPDDQLFGVVIGHGQKLQVRVYEGSTIPPSTRFFTGRNIARVAPTVVPLELLKDLWAACDNLPSFEGRELAVSP